MKFQHVLRQWGVTMNLNHLRYFEEVCRQGSITKASEICHISQPSITAAINGLEKELGYKLFFRINNHLHLTKEGVEFQKLTDQFLGQFSNYQKRACELTSNHKSHIRLGVPSILGTFFFEKIIPDFYQKHPEIELEFFEIATVDGVSMLNNAALDLLLGIQNDSCYTNCDSREIFTTELQLAVSRNHLLAREEKITDEMLADLPLVLISRGSYHYKAVQDKFEHIKLNPIMHSSQLSTIRYMVAGNHAATIIYKDIFEGDPQICCIPFIEPMPAQIHIFWQKHAYRNDAMKALISYISKLEI